MDALRGLSLVSDRSNVESTGAHQMLWHSIRNEAPVDRLTESPPFCNPVPLAQNCGRAGSVTVEHDEGELEVQVRDKNKMIVGLRDHELSVRRRSAWRPRCGRVLFVGEQRKGHQRRGVVRMATRCVYLVTELPDRWLQSHPQHDWTMDTIRRKERQSKAKNRRQKRRR
jgi:hypothetical protein